MSGLDIEGVLRGAGLTDEPGKYDSDIHSWRCSYPDIYGQCSCFQDLAADLREQIGAAMAEAWDEGWAARAQKRMPFLSAVHLDGNPYRAAQVAPSLVPGEEG